MIGHRNGRIVVVDPAVLVAIAPLQKEVDEEEIEKRMLRREMINSAVQPALERLSQVQREDLISWWFCGESQHAIAKRRNVKQAAVYNNICNALRNLRKDLKAFWRSLVFSRKEAGRQC